MKDNKKILSMALVAAFVAAGSSALTVTAMKNAGALSAGGDPIMLTSGSAGNAVDTGKGYYAVSQGTVMANTDFTKAAESTVNGVVSIKSFATPRYNRSSRGGSPFGGDDLFEFFFGPSQPRRQERRGDVDPGDESNQQQTGLGSGVVISPDGYIVTNNHVIDGADRLEVTLNDNRSFNATVVGSDPNTDLALVKIDVDGLSVIPMGDSDRLKVGEWVLAVGNPFGFTSTVTTGIVSAKARSISGVTHSRNMGIESYIQTDAAVNPGNSGGALVNLNGELVGINTAIYSNTGSYSGYSFAIPTSIVKKVVSDIRQFGSVQRAVLGIGINDLTAKLAKEKDITAVNEGVYVASVADRSSAREAGIEVGDVITAINGTPVKNSAALQEQVARYRPGDKITVDYVRANKRHTVNVTLLNNQGTTKVTAAGTVTDLGCAFKPVDEATCKELRISSGLQVTGLKEGKFKNAGIKDGFIILDINNARVSKVEDVEKIYNAIVKSDDDHVMFITGIYPTGRKMYYAVDLTD